MDADRKLVLLDAHALIHRAYHAIDKDLLSPQGEPTKAVFGFASTLLKVLKDVRPMYVAAAFDVGKSFRSEQFAEYKATRPKLADDLSGQIERVRQLCEVFGIPIFAQPGFEADDLLGALAAQASARGIDTIVVTGDTDTFQLIGPHTSVLMFLRLGDAALYDEARIEERYGLRPQQLIDLKALRGDPSDNIPGVSGIGDKTATRLLQEYGSVEEILAHLDELDAKNRERLRAAREQLLLSKQLVTIDVNAPVKLDLDAARFGGYDREQVLALFRELGFQSLLSRLPDSGDEPTGQASEPSSQLPDGNYHLVTTPADLERLAARLRTRGGFVVDVETTSLDELTAELVGIAIGVGQGEAYYVPIGHQEGNPPVPVQPGQAQPSLFAAAPAPLARRATPQLTSEQVVEALGPIFKNRAIKKYAHNAKYDLIVLARAGLPLEGLTFDTLIAAHLIEPSGQKLGLKELTFTKFGVQMTEIEGLIGKGKNQIPMSHVSIEQAGRYACADADYTFRLMELYAPLLKERKLDTLFEQVEMPLVPVIVELEQAGVLLDVEALARLSRQLSARMEGLEKQIYAHVGAPFNLGSPQQLSEALFVKLKLPSSGLERTRTGQISTAAGVLEKLAPAHPVIGLILEHRELSKLKGTYVDALPQLVSPSDGRLHTSYNQAGTVTGRISSSNPNLQNIPIKSELGREVRRAFIAPPGSLLLSADYSQVELRILAHISQDQNLLHAFAEGEDIHAATAATLFNVPIEKVTHEQRRLGKTINFGVVYGISDWGVMERTELSLEESRRLIDDYFKKYPGVREYVERTKEQARTQGYVESLMGRRRYFPELASGRRIPPGLRGQAEREAINMPIQATAADIIKCAMVSLFQELNSRGLKSKMILQVHDELVLECPKEELPEVAELVCNVMEHAFELDAPLKVDVSAGQNWDELEPVQV